MKIMVADRDKISKFSRFILTLTKTLIGAGFGAVTGGITNVLLGAAVNLALNEYKESLNIDKDEHIDIIGVAETKIDLNTPQNTVTMNLKAPKLIEKSYYKIQSPPLTGVDRVTETILRKGEDNGIIELQISYADM